MRFAKYAASGRGEENCIIKYMRYNARSAKTRRPDNSKLKPRPHHACTEIALNNNLPNNEIWNKRVAIIFYKKKRKNYPRESE